MYIDGYLADEDYINSNSLFSDPVHPFVQVGGILQGGSGPLIQQYNGYFDNISFWSYPLSSNELQNFINCPPTGNEEGLVGFGILKKEVVKQYLTYTSKRKQWRYLWLKTLVMTHQNKNVK